MRAVDAPTDMNPTDSVDPHRKHLGTWVDVRVDGIEGFPDAVERIYKGSLD